MVETPCVGFLLLWGIGAFIVGCYATYFAILAWTNRNSKLLQHWHWSDRYPTKAEAGTLARALGFTREAVVQRNITTLRWLGPILGPLFIIGGLAFVREQLRCANIAAEFTPAVHLQFKFWPPMVPFAGFAAAIAIVNAVTLRLRPLSAAAVVLFIVAWAVCGAEAAAYHTGEMANRWGTASFVPFVLAAFISAVEYLRRRRAARS